LLEKKVGALPFITIEETESYNLRDTRELNPDRPKYHTQLGNLKQLQVGGFLTETPTITSHCRRPTRQGKKNKQEAKH
jgi:hypothetical protein